MGWVVRAASDGCVDVPRRLLPWDATLSSDSGWSFPGAFSFLGFPVDADAHPLSDSIMSAGEREQLQLSGASAGDPGTSCPRLPGCTMGVVPCPTDTPAAGRAEMTGEEVLYKR